MIVAFSASRAGAYAFGVRFNPNSINCMPQIIDPKLLSSRLLESLFYLHSQPPLFNLTVGIFLHLFPSRFGSAINARETSSNAASDGATA